MTPLKDRIQLHPASCYYRPHGMEIPTSLGELVQLHGQGGFPGVLPESPLCQGQVAGRGPGHGIWGVGQSPLRREQGPGLDSHEALLPSRDARTRVGSFSVASGSASTLKQSPAN